VVIPPWAAPRFLLISATGVSHLPAVYWNLTITTVLTPYNLLDFSRMFGRNYSQLAIASTPRTRSCSTRRQFCSRLRLRLRDPLLRLGIIATLFSSLVVSVHSTPTIGFASDSTSAAPLNWHHPPSHPVHKLFRRDADESLPTVGSDGKCSTVYVTSFR
jgi:hypothetical protein